MAQVVHSTQDNTGINLDRNPILGVTIMSKYRYSYTTFARCTIADIVQVPTGQLYTTSINYWSPLWYCC